LVLAVEALLELQDRETSAKKVVDYLIEYTKDSQLDKQDKDSIMGSLRWLYKESISKSLREIAQNYLGDRKYNNMCAKKFINQCYDIRSKLMHTGKVDIKVINLGKLAAQLNVFVSDLLVEMTGISNI
jgi:hypothetical protein